jgi:type VI secretion system protein ImpG
LNAVRERLLEHYNSELAYVRQMAGEFAREYPKIAGRLGLDPSGHEVCPDPFVERLLEGFAYLTARIQTKFDAEFPRLTQALLESVFPHYLCPAPSMLIAGFEPDETETGLATGYALPRGTLLRGNLGRSASVPAQFRTAHAVTLWPLRIKEAAYTARDIGAFELPAHLRPKSVLRLRLEITADVAAGDLTVDDLDIYLRGSGELPFRLHEQILAHGGRVVLQSGTGRQRKTIALNGPGIGAVGFSPEESLLPVAPRSFEGYRLLREYFVFPQRFLFFKLRGLRQAVPQMTGKVFDVLILFDNDDMHLENRLDETMFALFCTPAINLFEKRIDRIALSDRFSEYQVIADKTRMVEFEIFDLVRVEGIGSQADETYKFTPFYFNYDRDLNSRAYYTLNRVPRTLSSREVQQGGVRYPGSEVYLSLVDGNNAPYHPDLAQLSITARCTNRHLPIQLPIGVGKTDFHLDTNAPLVATRALTSPTEPIPSLAEGELSWRIISHLTLNYLSLADTNPEAGAAALRELLRLYAEHPHAAQTDAGSKKLINALTSVSSRPIIRRVLTPGPIAFARGLEITVRVRESDFSGNSAFLFGAVLEQFFAKYVSINSFTETVLRGEGGEIKRWVARPGARDVL